MNRESVGDMKIFIWGTGRLAGKVVEEFIALSQIEAFIDNDLGRTEYMGKKVFRPKEIAEMDYDVICVANLYSMEIYGQCLDIGIDIDKVIFLYNNCKMTDINKDYAFIESVLGKEYASVIRKRYHIVRGVEAYGDLFLEKCEIDEQHGTADYIRIKTFELAVKELRKRNVGGAVAEVGVFRGEFAQYINYAFPDRKCYLFDTFEGFQESEALKELKSGNCTKAFVEAYKNTNMQYVLGKMKNIENVVIKKGYFPDSLEGLEETFAFVSLDVDFEDSICEGLKYFYPRLMPGGYIFVHDYNSSLLGVEKAVDRFENDFSINLCKIPMCDANGTLVITKT